MTLEEIIKKLEENNEAVRNGGTPFSLDELHHFTNQLSVQTQDSSQFILLYSGGLQPDGNGSFKSDGLQAWQVAKAFGDNNANIGLVDQTPAMRLVFSEAFDQAVQNTAASLSVKKQDIIFGSIDPNGNRIDGLVDDISRRFIHDNANKPFIMLTPFANLGSTYIATELPEFKNAQGADIAGLSREIIQDIGDEKTRLAIAALSFEQAANLHYSFDSNGRLIGVDAAEFWGSQFKNPENMRTQGGVIISQADLFEKLHASQIEPLTKGAEIANEVLPEKTSFETLERLAKNSGLIGSIVFGGAIMGAAYKETGSIAHAAEAGGEAIVPYGETAHDIYNGDLEAAQRSATIETASNGGSLAGASGGAAIGTIVQPGGGTIIGGFFGALGGGVLVGEAAAFLYDKIDDIRDFFNHDDDRLFERLPIQINDTAPPALQHLVELKRLHVEVSENRQSTDDAQNKIERIENMYDEAYDLYSEDGQLEEALMYLRQTEIPTEQPVISEQPKLQSNIGLHNNNVLSP